MDNTQNVDNDNTDNIADDEIRPEDTDNNAEDEILPEDSVSQAESKSVSNSSRCTRVRLAAKKAALEAEAAALRRKYELEAEARRAAEQLEMFQLETKLAVADAKARVYEEERRSRTNSNASSEVKLATPVSNLNPLAQDFQNTTLETQQESVVMASPNSIETVVHEPSAVESLLAAVHMPQAQLMTFDGNPLHYWTFIRFFENNVERMTHDNVSRLTRLLQYCTGKAKKVVECCAVMQPTEGYAKARALLKERFGDNYVIAEAWVKRVTEGKTLSPHDREGLQEYADDLRSCEQTLKAMNYLSEINTQRVLVKIVARLPKHMQNRWVRQASDVRMSEGRSADIHDLVTFVNKAATVANDPVYGTLMADRNKSHNDEVTNWRPRKWQNNHTVQTSFSVAAEAAKVTPMASGGGGNKSRSSNCLICGGSHSLFQCEEFRKLTPEVRCKFAREKQLCFNCLLPGHQARACRLTRTCSVPGCSKKHTKFLHLVNTRSEPPQDSNEEVNRNGGRSVSIQEAQTGFANMECMATGAGVAATVKKVALPLVPVRAFAPDGSSVSTYALLDSGSTTTFCTKNLADSLRLEGKRGTLSLSTLEGTGRSFETLQVCLDVADVDGKNVIHIPSAYVRQNMPISTRSAATYDDIKEWPHLNGIELHCDEAHTVDLLIGQDCPEALLPLDIAKGEKNAPYAVKTVLGWTIHGPVGRSSEYSPAVVNFVETDTKLQECVERFWKLEYDECLADDQKGMSVSDRKAMACMQESVQRVDGHYEIAIPFKHRPVDLPNNRAEAERRLQYLGNRLNRDQRLQERYRDGMEEMVTKGYASKVTEEELNRKDGAVWYLPHHPVLNPNKPDKVRIVFDCAAQYKGTSLNDNVMQGPDLTNQLIGVLLRFRQEPVAVMADIEAMFHQVRVACSDRDVLRYLWWPNGELIQQPQVYRMNVHLFGGTWSPSCSNFALHQTARDNQNDFSVDAVNTVQRNFYVDDCLKSVENEDKAVMLVKELSSLLGRGGFKLTKWTSTSRTVLASIPEEDRMKDIRSIDLDHEALPVERALGVFWDVEDDCFSFKVATKVTPSTRRGLLSTVSSIYDPFGFIAPYTVTAKKIIQDLTVKGLGWDEPLDDVDHNRWTCWLQDLPKLQTFRIGRCLKPPESDTLLQYELHHFADASEIAYGTVTYLRVTDCRGSAHCNLLMAKCRLTPKKTVTVPRLELMAAALAVKVDRMMRRELDFTLPPSVFWTDSTIVLQYIISEEKRFKTFVANRVALIRDASNPEQWRHVSSEMNPADDLSRGLTADEILTKSRWVNGPSFLWNEKHTWPNNVAVCEVDQNDVELKGSTLKQSFSTQASQQPDVIDRLLCRRSDWFSLKKDVAWIQRFITYLQNKSKLVTQKNDKQLSVLELQLAEQAIVRYIQRTHFSEEFNTFRTCSSSYDSGKFARKGSVLCKLCPFVNSNGVLCVGGRLRHSPSLSSEAKYPMILPKKHHVVDLIVRHVHDSSGHIGREHVLSLLREKYWIIHGRAAVRRILGNCVTCTRLTARCGEQFMADLPVQRITAESPPFTNVGVDLFGPFVIRRGRSDVKRYGCLFTCLVIRAIHIEIVHSMDTDSFLNALQRFMCRRGQPAEIFSDNGTNFRSGDRELRKAIQEWNKHQIMTYLQQRDIVWRFNPPAASHWGGVWERQIRTVRKILSSLLKEQVLDDEGLHTVMCQAEYIVNSRPLTAVSDDPYDLEALTPNHLLTMRNISMIPLGISVKEDCYCRRRWKQVRYMSDVFWRRWSREYLPSLQQRTKWFTATRDFKPGDIVLLVEDTPRCSWPLARITSVHPGSDGRVRSVTLKSRGSSAIKRPISKICLLEGACVNDTSMNCEEQ